MMTDAEKTKKLRKDVAPFAKSETSKSIFQIVNTISPLLVTWGARILFSYNFHRGYTAVCSVIGSRICCSYIYYFP